VLLLASENFSRKEKVEEPERLTRDNLMPLENNVKIGQILLLLMSQYGLLELEKQQLQKLLKRLMLRSENG